MANNVIQYIIEIKEKAKGQTQKIGAAFNKVNADARKLATTSKQLTRNIADIRGELAAAERKRSFSNTVTDIKKCNTNIKTLNKELNRLQNLPPNSFFSRLKRAATAFTGLSVRDMGITYLAMKVRRFTAESIKLFDVQQKAEAQVKATLDSVGFTAGRTFSQITKQAADLQKKTTFGDETILKMQSQLLTFKAIRGKIFDQATPLILDYATKMGKDLQTSVVLIGKALNDPVKGITGLRRVGINLLESQQEEIKKLVAAGDLEAAQLVLLSELQTRFGGSAEAAALAGLGPMQQLRNAWNDLREKIGGVVLRVLNHVIPAAKSVITWMSENGRTLKTVAKTLITVTAATVAFKVAHWAVIITTGLFTGLLKAKNVVLALVTGGLTKAKIAMLAFNKATKANVIGIVVAGITAAATAFSLFGKRTNATSKALNDAKKAASDYYAQERSQLDMIFAKLRETNPKSAERNRLVNELMQMYPEMNRKQLDELRNTNNLAAAYETLAASIAKKARVKGMESSLEKLSVQTATVDMAIENFINNKLNRSNFKSDDEYYLARNNLRNEVIGNLPHSGTIMGEYKDSDYKDGLKSELYKFLKNNKLIVQKSVGTMGVIIPFDSDEYKASKKAYKEIANVQKFLSSYMFEPMGSGGSGGSAILNGGGETNAVDSITAGGKSVKNFNITINDGLIKQVDNHFASTNENPATAGDFMWAFSQALQMMLNDINYTAK
jgi:hypothetical protein